MPTKKRGRPKGSKNKANKQSDEAFIKEWSQTHAGGSAPKPAKKDRERRDKIISDIIAQAEIDFPDAIENSFGKKFEIQFIEEYDYETKCLLFVWQMYDDEFCAKPYERIVEHE